jgi:Na+/H+ antiporter NhaD/arsenite permease-like protein
MTEFVIFGLTLLGVAIFHRHSLLVALLGLASVTLFKLLHGDFHGQPGWLGLLWHLEEEWVILTNLFALLVGFALLSRHFEESHLPRLLPRVLPDDWKGGLVLLSMVFVLSAFLDNIAAAMIGATVAGAVYRRKLHIGYLAAIVAASNAGGSGSVIGDTTTTMMASRRSTCCTRTSPPSRPFSCSPFLLHASSRVTRPSRRTRKRMSRSTGRASSSWY